jgi:hypothetical protein
MEEAYDTAVKIAAAGDEDKGKEIINILYEVRRRH